MDYLVRLAPNSIFPILRVDLRFSDFELGLLVSVFLWTYGILSPAAGFIGDRFSRRTVVIAAVAAWSVVTMLSAAVTRPWHFIVMRGVLGAAEVCFMPTAQALIADYHDVTTRSKAVGLFEVGSYCGIFLAGLPVAYSASRLGWRIMLLLCGVIGLMLAYAMHMSLPRTANSERAADYSPISVAEALSVLKVPSVLAITVCFCLHSASFWVTTAFLPLFIYEHHHLSLELAAFRGTFYNQLSAAIIMPVFGAISDFYSSRNPTNRFSICAIAILAAPPALLAVGLGAHASTLLFGLLLLGVPAAATDASWMPMLCNVTAPRRRATAFGLLNMASCLTGGIAALVAALLMKSLGLGIVITSLGALYVALCALLLFAGYVLLPRDSVAQQVKAVIPG
jgi:MFS family permease